MKNKVWLFVIIGLVVIAIFYLIISAFFSGKKSNIDSTSQSSMEIKGAESEETALPLTEGLFE